MANATAVAGKTRAEVRASLVEVYGEDAIRRLTNPTAADDAAVIEDARRTIEQSDAELAAWLGVCVCSCDCSCGCRWLVDEWRALNERIVEDANR